MTGPSSYREEHLPKHCIDVVLLYYKSFPHSFLPHPFPYINRHSLNNCSQMGSCSFSFWSEVQICAWDRWVYHLPQFYIPVGLEAIAPSSTRWPQNAIDRKDLENRIIRTTKRMSKEKNVTIEGYSTLKKSRATQIVYYITVYGAPGNIARCIIWTQRKVSKFFLSGLFQIHQTLGTFVITIITQQ